MYIPEPVLALVLAYHTDGQPVRRVLAGTAQTRGDDRRLDQLVDMVAYQVAREKKGRFIAYVAVVVAGCMGRKEAMYDCVLYSQATPYDAQRRRPKGVLAPLYGIPQNNFIFYDYDRGGVGVHVYYRSEPVGECAATIVEQGGTWWVCW